MQTILDCDPKNEGAPGSFFPSDAALTLPRRLAISLLRQVRVSRLVKKVSEPTLICFLQVREQGLRNGKVPEVTSVQNGQVLSRLSEGHPLTQP